MKRKSCCDRRGFEGIKLGAGKAVSVRVGTASGHAQRCLMKCAWV